MSEVVIENVRTFYPSLCFLSCWPSLAQARLPCSAAMGMRCGGRNGSVHTPSGSSESNLRRSVVSQHLWKACSPNVHVCTVQVVTLIKAPQQHSAHWRRRISADCEAARAPSLAQASLLFLRRGTSSRALFDGVDCPPAIGCESSSDCTPQVSRNRLWSAILSGIYKCMHGAYMCIHVALHVYM